MLLLLLVAPTLRGQNSGSSKRDSTVFIYVDTAPLLFLLRLFLFFSLFLGCLYAFSVLPFPFLRRSARDCETSFSDTIQARLPPHRTLPPRFTLLFLLCYSVTLELRSFFSFFLCLFIETKRAPIFREARLHKCSSSFGHEGSTK